MAKTTILAKTPRKHFTRNCVCVCGGGGGGISIDNGMPLHVRNATLEWSLFVYRFRLFIRRFLVF